VYGVVPSMCGRFPALWWLVEGLALYVVTKVAKEKVNSYY
jgi:hypothetical protein